MIHMMIIFSKIPVLNEIEVTHPSCFNDIILSSNLILCKIIVPLSKPIAITSTTGDCVRKVIGDSNEGNEYIIFLSHKSKKKRKIENINKK